MPYVRAVCVKSLGIAVLTELSTGLQPSYPQEMLILLDRGFPLFVQVVTLSPLST